MRIRRIFLLFAGLLLAGPVSANPETPWIVNGDTELGFESAVALGVELGDSNYSVCSGNLITPRIILSAGHCGEGVSLELVVSAGKAFFGVDVQDPDDVLGFVNMEIHPDYVPLESGFGGTLGEYDFGILELEEDALVEPTWFRRDDLTEEDEGTTMLSVGYGATSSTGAGSGTRRSTDLVLDEVDEMFLIANTGLTEGEGQICSGDSGGPQLVEEDGRWVQWAVHSWGDQTCLYQSGSTRVDLVDEWILDFVEDVHGTRDVCEANGWYGDGTCDEICETVDPDCIEDTGDPDEGGAKACGCSQASPETGYLFLLIAPLLLLRRGTPSA
jgi:hypothetical protein